MPDNRYHSKWKDFIVVRLSPFRFLDSMQGKKKVKLNKLSYQEIYIFKLLTICSYS